MKIMRLFLITILIVACSDNEPSGNQNPNPNIDNNGELGKTYRGNKVLSTQAEIDEFAAENFVEVTGRLTIADTNDPSTIVNVSGLNSLRRVQGSLTIQENDNLTSIAGFSGLTEINSALVIIENNSLESINGFNNLESIGGVLEIENNNSSFSIAGFSNLTEVTASFNVNNLNLPIIESLNAFGNLKTIGDGFFIGNINGNLDSFNKLTNVTGNLHVELVETQNLQFLNSLSNIGGTMTIIRNGQLQSLSGIENLTALGGILEIKENSSLSNFCGLQNLLNEGWSNQASIEQNSFNPTIDEIGSGNCSN